MGRKRKLDDGSDEDRGAEEGTKARGRIQRPENSLHSQTQRFVRGLGELEGDSDVSAHFPRLAAENSIPKRRYYDITGVLEGIGLLERHDRAVRWRGPRNGLEERNSKEVYARLERARARRDELEADAERAMDELREVFFNGKAHAYVSAADLRDLFPDSSMLAVSAPEGTDVSAPCSHDRFGQSYEVVVTNRDGLPLEVLAVGLRDRPSQPNVEASIFDDESSSAFLNAAPLDRTTPLDAVTLDAEAIKAAISNAKLPSTGVNDFF